MFDELAAHRIHLQALEVMVFGMLDQLAGAGLVDRAALAERLRDRVPEGAEGPDAVLRARCLQLAEAVAELADSKPQPTPIKDQEAP